MVPIQSTRGKNMSKSAWSSRPAILALAAASVGFAGCESMSDRQRHTAVGAGAGAATGAVVGKATGGNAATGAVVGGAIGAVAGNLWSRRMEDKRAEMNRATQGTGIQVTRTNDNQLRVAVPSDFSFDTGSAAIKPQMRPVLDQFAQGLSPNQRVTVVGHTDNVGGDVVNNRLSLERAAAVREYLRAHGVDTSRVMVNGRGEAEPIASNDTATGRAENRRVEIFLSEPARG
jgi:outer membrane protein OmpA-like peptidoglycan-associated protein